MFQPLRLKAVEGTIIRMEDCTNGLKTTPKLGSVFLPRGHNCAVIQIKGEMNAPEPSVHHMCCSPCCHNGAIDPNQGGMNVLEPNLH